jgi:hypothetical protein
MGDESLDFSAKPARASVAAGSTRFVPAAIKYAAGDGGDLHGRGQRDTRDQYVPG